MTAGANFPESIRLDWLSLVIKYLLVLAFTVCAANHVAAGRIPPQVKFKATLPNELEKIGFINSIIEDDVGYLWFGAIKGLARYDGYQLKIYSYNEDDPHSLSHPWVKKLLLDHDGQLWVTTHTGLCQYLEKSDNFDCFTGEPVATEQNPVEFYYLYEDSRGKMWASTSQGMRYFSPGKRKFSGLSEPLNSALKPERDSDDNFVTALAEDHQRSVWIGLSGNGILRYDQASNSLVHYHQQDGASRLPSNNIREIFVDSNDTVWVGSEGGGVSRFDRKSESFTRLVHSTNEKADAVWDIVEDRTGLFWIADGSGVHIYEPSSGKFAGYHYIEGKTGGPGNFVARDLFIDSANGIWAGYFPSGVDKVDLQASEFINYMHDPNDPQSLADGGVLTTEEDLQGNLWVGCGFGLSYLDRHTGAFKNYVHEPDNPASLGGSTVLDLLLQEDGTLWVGTWDRGLNRRNPFTEEFHRYQENLDDPHSLFGREPWALARDSQAVLWVATEKGINRYNSSSDDFTRVMPNDDDGRPLTQLYTRHINLTRDGKLWIASFDGVYVLDPRSNTYTAHYTHNETEPHSLSWDQVLTTFQDTAGNIWVGTFGGGLDLFVPELDGFEHFGLESGLPDTSVTGIIEDTEGYIWVSTYQGLARFDTSQRRFSHFDKHDGLVSNLFNRNSPSLLRSGELVFGSSRGLTIFDPRALQRNTHLPPVVFTDFQIFNQTIAPGPTQPLATAIGTSPTIHLDHKQSVFSIEFAGLDYNSPNENQYAYRLIGFEHTWNQVGNRRQATYTNLDAGTYTFEVKASNNNGVWNPKPAKLSIVVAPPYWKTPLAYTLYAFIAVTGAAILYRTQRNKLERQRVLVQRLQEIDRMKDQINRNLDRKVAERTKALQEEHERLQETQQQLQSLNKKLDDASVTDQLTGLNNRRFLYRTIQSDVMMVAQQYELAKSQIYNDDALNDLTFFVVDIDDFKEVNDEYGHAAGDCLLVQFSHILRSVLRDDDYIVRWGGEEFVIVIRNLARGRINNIATRLLDKVQQHRFDIGGSQYLHKTCSIGIACYPFIATAPRKLDWEQVIGLADQALYGAKSSGKNAWVRLDAAPNIKADFTNSTVSNEKLKDLLNCEAIVASSSLNTAEIHWKL